MIDVCFIKCSSVTQGTYAEGAESALVAPSIGGLRQCFFHYVREEFYKINVKIYRCSSKRVGNIYVLLGRWWLFYPFMFLFFKAVRRRG